MGAIRLLIADDHMIVRQRLRAIVYIMPNIELAGEAGNVREAEVLELVARGLSNRQIADALTVSEKTVSVHITNLLSKLGLASRTQAALYAARSGLVLPGDLA